jgi:hypothetical protein
MKTMLKKEDWGGIAVASLLATLAFPPYFIHLMTMAALSEFAHLYTTMKERLEKDRERFQAFEKEFRKGWRLEKAGDKAGAILLYLRLEKDYATLPQAAKIAALRIAHLGGQPEKARAAGKSRNPAGSKASRRKKARPRKGRARP